MPKKTSKRPGKPNKNRSGGPNRVPSDSDKPKRISERSERPARPGERPSRPGERPARPGERPTRVRQEDRPARPARPGERPARPGQRPTKPGERSARPGDRNAPPGRRPFERNQAAEPDTEVETKKLPPEVKLPPRLVDAWRETLIKFSKLPTGTSPKDENRNALAGRILVSQSSDIAHLWEIFTTERGDLTRNLLSTKRLAAAYLGGFHLANAARVQLLLERTEKRTNIKNALIKHRGHIVWNDFGCGTGAVAQTIANKLISWRKEIQADFHLTDTTSTLLDIAEAATKSAAPTFKVLKHKKFIEDTDLETMLRGQDDTLFGYSLGYVWNELKKNKRAQKHLLDLFTGHITQKQDALIVVMEPANQVIARDAMMLRNNLVALGYVPIYPCPTANACPMLDRTRDWCFSEGTWLSPPLMQTIEKNLGIDRSRFSTAAYMFASPKLAGQIMPAGKMSPITVGRPQKISEKGLQIRGIELLICDGKTLSKKPGSAGRNFHMRGMPPIG